MSLSVPIPARLLIDKIIAQEGGWRYTDDPVDPDKGTFAGIRYKTFNKYFEDAHDNGGSPEAFKELVTEVPLDEATTKAIYEIYYKDYYMKLPMQEITRQFQEMLFSCAVNCGIWGASKILQRATNLCLKGRKLEVDGIIGVITKTGLRSIIYRSENITKFRRGFVDFWMQRYFKILIVKPAQVKFIKGWYYRAIQYRN